MVGEEGVLRFKITIISYFESIIKVNDAEKFFIICSFDVFGHGFNLISELLIIKIGPGCKAIK